MKTHKLFISNQSQAVRIPKSMAFDPSVKEVVILRHGNGLLIKPKDDVWTDFFSLPPCSDFMEEGRDQENMQERESF